MIVRSVVASDDLQATPLLVFSDGAAGASPTTLHTMSGSVYTSHVRAYDTRRFDNACSERFINSVLRVLNSDSSHCAQYCFAVECRLPKHLLTSYPSNCRTGVLRADASSIFNLVLLFNMPRDRCDLSGAQNDGLRRWRAPK